MYAFYIYLIPQRCPKKMKVIWEFLSVMNGLDCNVIFILDIHLEIHYSRTEVYLHSCFSSTIRWWNCRPPPHPAPLHPRHTHPAHTHHTHHTGFLCRYPHSFQSKNASTGLRVPPWRKVPESDARRLPSKQPWRAGWLKCCFTSTETVGLLGMGAQPRRVDFHTAPEL